jgi:hypothetical protein
MLFMLIVKASTNSEGGNRPNYKLNEAMTIFNKELIEAGVRIMAKGLHPSSNGLKISYLIEDEEPVITEGPFTDSNDLIAGFIIIDVASKEEAIKWAKRMPDPQGNGEGVIELRQIYE